MTRLLILFACLLTACASNSSNQAGQGGAAPITHEPYGSEMKPFETYPPAELTWKPGPPSLPAGALMTLLEGDPTKEGPFVFRLKLPDGFTIPPHMHTRAERVTVIVGTFNVAEGDTIDKTSGKAKVMTAGTFGYWPARMHHYAWASGGGGVETIIQLHGFGPWKIEYLNPADDPRNATKQ